MEIPKQYTMKDSLSISRVRLLHPKIRDEVAELIGKIEINNPAFSIRIVQSLRTIEEQNELWAQGRTKPGNVVTKAKGGSSYHNYGLAFDFAILYSGKISWDLDADIDHDGKADWMEVVDTFKTNGYTWGGDFHSIPDAPHLEKNFGHNWRDLLIKYNKKDFIPGTQYVNI